MDVIPRERNRNDRDNTDSWNGTPLMEPTNNGDISKEVALCELKLRQVALQILHGNWPASQFSFTGSRGNQNLKQMSLPKGTLEARVGRFICSVLRPKTIPSCDQLWQAGNSRSSTNFRSYKPIYQGFPATRVAVDPVNWI